MTRAIILTAAALWLTGCHIQFDSERYSEDFHMTRDLKAGGRFSLENQNGAVEVVGWDKDQVDISGAKYGSTPEMRDAVKIDVQGSGDSVSIRTIHPTVSWRGGGARYVVRVPRKVQLDRVVSTNGSIRLTDIEGNARAKSTNGAVRVNSLKGALDAQTTNGSMEVEDVTGGAGLHSTNGAIRVRKLQGSMDATTTNGSIHAEIGQPESGRAIRAKTTNGTINLTIVSAVRNDIRAQTSNGGITLKLPAETNARIDASAGRNSIKSEFDVRDGNQDRRRLEGVIGKGGPLIELSTSHGSIKILKN